MIGEAEARAMDQRITDADLISQYGRDAPKSRSFMTPKNNPKVEEEYNVGGRIKKKKPAKKNSGKVRGAGKVIKGVRPTKMISMKGS